MTIQLDDRKMPAYNTTPAFCHDCKNTPPSARAGVPYLSCHRDPSLRSGLLAKVPGPDSYRDCPVLASGNTTSLYYRALMCNPMEKNNLTYSISFTYKQKTKSSNPILITNAIFGISQNQ